MKNNWLNIPLAIILLASPIAMCRKAIAQEAIPETPHTDASSLTGTTPATSSTNNSFENTGNGVQNINNANGFSGNLAPPTCTSRICPFAIGRITPNGSEIVLGVIANLGGSADEDRAMVEKLRAELEGVKESNAYKLALYDKLAVAIDSGNSIRIRVIAIALAPLEGYANFREYLRDLLNENG